MAGYLPPSIRRMARKGTVGLLTNRAGAASGYVERRRQKKITMNCARITLPSMITGKIIAYSTAMRWSPFLSIA